MSVEVTLRIGGQSLVAHLDDEALAAIAAAIGRDQPATPWLTIKAASEYLGLTEHAIRKLVDRGKIAKHQHIERGRIMLRRHDLDDYLSGMRARG